jgi:N-acetylmuramic acid 6-phosphate etherase
MPTTLEPAGPDRDGRLAAPPDPTPLLAAAGSGTDLRLLQELSGLVTEDRRDDLADLDLRPTDELVTLMRDEEAAVAAAIQRAIPQIAAAIDAIAQRMARGGRLIYIGAGTAGRVGVLDASECPPTFGVAPGTVIGLLAGGDTAFTAAVENAEDDEDAAVADLDRVGVGEQDSVVAITASGRTPYAVAAARHARRRGALTVGVACTPHSPVAAMSDHAIEVVVGPELLSGSTRLKAGTAQKLVLNMISTVVMIRLGRTYGNLMVDLRATNEKLRVRAVRIVEQAAGVAPEVAAAALRAAAGEVKPAILHLVRGIDVAEARRLLEAHGGHLRAAISS